MGRDEHSKGGKNAGSLPQTPKKQKLSASEMREEISRELDAIDTSVKQRQSKRKNK